MKQKKFTPTQCTQLARKIYEWCIKHELWSDCCIYFNNKAWSTSAEWNGVFGKKIDDKLYEYENKNPRDYFEYVRDPNILSMSFEGPLYYVLNGYRNDYTLEEQFSKIFEKYGLFYELGYAWSLSAYDL